MSVANPDPVGFGLLGHSDLDPGVKITLYFKFSCHIKLSNSDTDPKKCTGSATLEKSSMKAVTVRKYGQQPILKVKNKLGSPLKEKTFKRTKIKLNQFRNRRTWSREEVGSTLFPQTSVKRQAYYYAT